MVSGRAAAAAVGRASDASRVPAARMNTSMARTVAGHRRQRLRRMPRRAGAAGARRPGARSGARRRRRARAGGRRLRTRSSATCATPKRSPRAARRMRRDLPRRAPTIGYGCWTRRRCTRPTSRARSNVIGRRARGRRRANGPHQHRRRARDSARRPGREDTPVTLDDMVGPYKRSKFLAEQAALEAARARGAGRDRESLDADWRAGLQADADRADDRRFPQPPDAGLSRHRAQPGRRRGLRARPSAGRRARPNRREIHPGRREPHACGSCSSASPRFRVAGADDENSLRGRVWDSRSAPMRSRAT